MILDEFEADAFNSDSEYMKIGIKEIGNPARKMLYSKSLYVDSLIL